MKNCLYGILLASGGYIVHYISTIHTSQRVGAGAGAGSPVGMWCASISIKRVGVGCRAALPLLCLQSCG